LKAGAVPVPGPGKAGASDEAAPPPGKAGASDEALLSISKSGVLKNKLIIKFNQRYDFKSKIGVVVLLL
jgi:hypothetical protein